MASRVLSAMIDSAAASKWEVAKLDKMLEAKWNAVKRSYTDDQNEMKRWPHRRTLNMPPKLLIPHHHHARVAVEGQRRNHLQH